MADGRAQRCAAPACVGRHRLRTARHAERSISPGGKGGADALYIHGGYWQFNDKEPYAFLARHCCRPASPCAVGTPFPGGADVSIERRSGGPRVDYRSAEELGGEPAACSCRPLAGGTSCGAMSDARVAAASRSAHLRIERAVQLSEREAPPRSRRAERTAMLQRGAAGLWSSRSARRAARAGPAVRYTRRLAASRPRGRYLPPRPRALLDPEGGSPDGAIRRAEVSRAPRA